MNGNIDETEINSEYPKHVLPTNAFELSVNTALQMELSTIGAFAGWSSRVIPIIKRWSRLSVADFDRENHCWSSSYLRFSRTSCLPWQRSNSNPFGRVTAPFSTIWNRNHRREHRYALIKALFSSPSSKKKHSSRSRESNENFMMEVAINAQLHDRSICQWLCVKTRS